MRAFAAIGPAVDVAAAGLGTAEPVQLDGRRLRVAFCEVAEPRFEPGSDAHREAVLVRARAFSCNYRDGALAQAVLHPSARERIVVLGSELAGEVVAVGAGVEGWAPGDRVMACPSWGPGQAGGSGVATNHASRELSVLPAAKLARVPAGMDAATAAALALGATTAAAMVRRAGLAGGERVLVASAGSSTGLFLLSLLRGGGAAAVGLTSSPERARAVGEATGAPAVADAGEVGAVDVVFAPFADVALEGALGALRPGGRLVFCGLRRPAAREEGALAPLLVALIERNLTLVGNCLGTVDDLADAVAAWERGALRVPLDRTMPAAPGSAAAFFHRTFADRERLGKVVALHG